MTCSIVIGFVVIFAGSERGESGVQPAAGEIGARLR